MVLEKQVSLAQYTTLRVGGTARFFVCVHSVEELQEATAWAKEHRQPIFVIGGGSNVLIDDAGWSGLVIKNGLSGRVVEDMGNQAVVRVGAGEHWDELVRVTCEGGWWGLEHVSGIPGSVGAAPIQNINAYGVSVAETIMSVSALDLETGAVRTFTREECMFDYRTSFFKQPEGKHYCIIEVVFLLSKDDKPRDQYRSATQSVYQRLHDRGITAPTSLEVRNEVLMVRKNIGMLEGMYRSAGSFFMNTIVDTGTFEVVQRIVHDHFFEQHTQLSPWYWRLSNGSVKISTAFLMECTPYNKTTYHNQWFNDVVSISPVHTLSLITKEGATALDVKNFAEEIQRAVFETFRIEIVPEVNYITTKTTTHV